MVVKQRKLYKHLLEVDGRRAVPFSYADSEWTYLSASLFFWTKKRERKENIEDYQIAWHHRLTVIIIID